MKAKKVGKIIVIEGGDSSGKEVQSRLLYEKLKNKEYRVKLFEFPQYSRFFGRVVGRYLRGEFGGVFEISPWLCAIPYALDRFDSREKILAWLKDGNILILNRYVGSNLGYMPAKLPQPQRPQFTKWLEKLEYKMLGLPKEDISIFLNVSPRVGQRLTYQKDEKVYMKGSGRGDIHERRLNYLENVTKQFLWLAKHRRNWARIDCMKDRRTLRDKNAIHREILRILARGKIISLL